MTHKQQQNVGLPDSVRQLYASGMVLASGESNTFDVKAQHHKDLTEEFPNPTGIKSGSLTWEQHFETSGAYVTSSTNLEPQSPDIGVHDVLASSPGIESLGHGEGEVDEGLDLSKNGFSPYLHHYPNHTKTKVNNRGEPTTEQAALSFVYPMTFDKVDKAGRSPLYVTGNVCTQEAALPYVDENGIQVLGSPTTEFPAGKPLFHCPSQFKLKEGLVPQLDLEGVPILDASGNMVKSSGQWCESCNPDGVGMTDRGGPQKPEEEGGADSPWPVPCETAEDSDGKGMFVTRSDQKWLGTPFRVGETVLFDIVITGEIPPPDGKINCGEGGLKYSDADEYGWQMTLGQVYGGASSDLGSGGWDAQAKLRDGSWDLPLAIDVLDGEAGIKEYFTINLEAGVLGHRKLSVTCLKELPANWNVQESDSLPGGQTTYPSISITNSAFYCDTDHCKVSSHGDPNSDGTDATNDWHWFEARRIWLTTTSSADVGNY